MDYVPKPVGEYMTFRPGRVSLNVATLHLLAPVGVRRKPQKVIVLDYHVRVGISSGIGIVDRDGAVALRDYPTRFA